MAIYLAIKEVWRNRGRFFLFSLVIALITSLVLFIAALAQGLSNANKEYLSKLDAQLIVYQSKVQLSSASSQIGESMMNNILRVAGVAEIGSIGLSSAIVSDPITHKDINISIIGIEPGKLGMPPITSGQTINVSKANEVVVDRNFAMKTKVKIGDIFTIRSLQGKDYKDYSVKVIGMTTGQQYLFRPSVFLPYLTWDQIRSKPSAGSEKSEYTANIVAVKVDPGMQPDQVAAQIQSHVDNVEVVNLDTAIKAIPGYLVQQQTLNTMQIFTLLIGVLVIGGFFQIQMLQKIPLIGVLKAIGTSNLIVAIAVVTQIIIISTFGVALGGVITLLLSLGIPATVPIVFAGNSVITALLSLLTIGPLGGLVTVQRAVAVEPLTALGLSA
jgi:putative ABC transport system permease protein